jgi:hypothetical protein
MLASFLIILGISVILAVRSMKDFEVPDTIKKLINAKRAKGTILFLGKKIIHYK